MTGPRLILGSGSPRRLELLAQLGVQPDAVCAPDIDETPIDAEKPRDYVRRMAFEKAQASACAADEVVLCADTTVAIGRRILGKPEDASEAEAFLRLMSGRRHKVITAIAVKTPDGVQVKDVVTDVRMKRLNDVEIAGYIATNDWRGKAGGYGIQGPAGAFIPWISGSFAAVMGLPLVETANLLQSAGIGVWK
ncbi:nucleoside triphosphate pyrophosphatase [Octadecabacter sp. 1_MG-2023]|uniref:Maf family protein n=1 Tax=unclassified Octadecabacter TaxID=196158 RepID=UPI001C081536|nr:MULTISPECIES: nucleoside triphosphate pyrophosphatase [unclassified Octadecabacter]MBU2993977.1 septum formation inhibitor Maf [Octadecabacter sp. B2R22]MDO6735176.1 nucleoside triphosphate pyrophosphatase [Octadecabacter sp. 1_MG-2023]